ncbi:MAG: AmmeMemoRadiSam system radical SAM enzyme [Candidatus Omnitrophica bacterium]|nr:AmmeMemoRadiSam system radical SAM enzyme [Candidatus Omnitrophota bacterium]
MKKEAYFWERIGDGNVQCLLCAHRCRIRKGYFGNCGMRQNIDGTLITYTYGKIIAANVDPIEKKPLYHFLPGTSSYSIATPGCNFKCGFCQNWSISQLSKQEGDDSGYDVSPKEVINDAIMNKCQSISYTYTEPTIFYEYARDISIVAKERGLKNIFVTNGYMTEEVIADMITFIDAANVDLKSFNDETYRKVCGARLQPVLDSIVAMKNAGIWVEITTLIVPGMNDTIEELSSIAGFIKDVNKKIPWHISRFHPSYNYGNMPATPLNILKEAYKIGKGHGLDHVYLGNVPEGS